MFEPRAANLSPMTPDLGIYVRDVQQSIGVNIRNYMKNDETRDENGTLSSATNSSSRGSTFSAANTRSTYLHEGNIFMLCFQFFVISQ